MPGTSITVDAVFENGVLRPVTPLSLHPSQRVTLIVQLAGETTQWPADVAAIYQEIAAEDRRLANAIWPTVADTWPRSEEPA